MFTAAGSAAVAGGGGGAAASGFRAPTYGGWQHAAAAQGGGGLLGTLYETWCTGGSRSLFVATEALCFRIGVGTAAQFSFYDLAKRRLVADFGASSNASTTQHKRSTPSN